MTQPANDRDSTDPLIDEVRALRAALAERFGGDVKQLAEYLRRVQDEHKADHPIRRLPPAPGATRPRAASGVCPGGR
ncbi:MAG: hypothetical protein ACF8LL_13845, partial [Phycisphaerales bacterium]